MQIHLQSNKVGRQISQHFVVLRRAFTFPFKMALHPKNIHENKPLTKMSCFTTRCPKESTVSKY